MAITQAPEGLYIRVLFIFTVTVDRYNEMKKL